MFLGWGKNFSFIANKHQNPPNNRMVHKVHIIRLMALMYFGFIYHNNDLYQKNKGQNHLPFIKKILSQNISLKTHKSKTQHNYAP